MNHRIHFIGICGTAMATVAAMLKDRGWDVRGSDQNVYPPMSTFLAAKGVRLLDGTRPDTSRRSSIWSAWETPSHAAIRSWKWCSSARSGTVRSRSS